MAIMARTNGQVDGTAAPATPRSRFVPSEQQERFLDAIRTGDSHLLLEARAGSGKSTTCREGARLLPLGTRAWYACFNAHIAREFQEDLPASCRARTLHSFGLELIRKKLGDIQIDDDKVDRLAEPYFPDRFQRGERSSVARLVSILKNQLIPADLISDQVLDELAATFGVDIPDDARGEVYGVAAEVFQVSFDRLSTIDFDDMVWLPVVMGFSPVNPPDVLFVDEAQDLNACQHHLVDQLCPTGRMVVVGDRYQSIYRFRGADSYSIERFERRLARSDRGIDTYPLTVTRRCPIRHVEMARRLVRDLDHLPGAMPGEVSECKPADVAGHLQPGDMVLCRTNAPLVSQCYSLIRQGRKAIVRGRDIGRGLLALMAKLRPSSVADLTRAVADHRSREMNRLAALLNPENAQQTVGDKCDCLLALTEGAATVNEVRERIETLFSDATEEGAIVLSSIHKAKGLERDHILVLRPDLLPGPWAKDREDMQQERNVAYVCATRARRRLTFAGPIPAILGGSEMVSDS